jgi:hypothetical protein
MYHEAEWIAHCAEWVPALPGLRPGSAGMTINDYAPIFGIL